MASSTPTLRPLDLLVDAVIRFSNVPPFKSDGFRLNQWFQSNLASKVEAETKLKIGSTNARTSSKSCSSISLFGGQLRQVLPLPFRVDIGHGLQEKMMKQVPRYVNSHFTDTLCLQGGVVAVRALASSGTVLSEDISAERVVHLVSASGFFSNILWR